jgi:hypothetical protein
MNTEIKLDIEKRFNELKSEFDVRMKSFNENISYLTI